MTCPRCRGDGWVCENHPDLSPNHDDQRCEGAGVPCPACNDLAHPRLPADWINLASEDDPVAPSEVTLFTLERQGVTRRCVLVDHGRYGAEATLRDGAAHVYGQRHESLAEAMAWAQELRKEMERQGWL